MQGFVYDYSDTFSPVLRFNSYRLVISITAYYVFEMRQLDIKGVYLNRKLNETIYMRQPKEREDGIARVCRLQYTQYRLKYSGKEWNKTLKEFFTKTERFVSLKREHVIFVRKVTKN